MQIMAHLQLYSDHCRALHAPAWPPRCLLVRFRLSPSLVCSTHALATPTASSLIRAITPTRSVTEIAPRASRILKRCEHFRHSSYAPSRGKRFRSASVPPCLTFSGQFARNAQSAPGTPPRTAPDASTAFSTFASFEVVDRNLQLIRQPHIAICLTLRRSPDHAPTRCRRSNPRPAETRAMRSSP